MVLYNIYNQYLYITIKNDIIEKKYQHETLNIDTCYQKRGLFEVTCKIALCFVHHFKGVVPLPPFVHKTNERRLLKAYIFSLFIILSCKQ